MQHTTEQTLHESQSCLIEFTLIDELFILLYQVLCS